MGLFDQVRSFAVAAVVLVIGFALLYQFKLAAERGLDEELREISYKIKSLIVASGPGFETRLKVPDNTVVNFSGYRIQVTSGNRTHFVPNENFDLPLDGPLLGPGEHILRIELENNVITITRVFQS